MASDGETHLIRVSLTPGTRLNDTYEIDAHIASGGMGEVYRGHNIETGEPVAIKSVRPEFAEDETILALFKKEATVLGRLRHDTIVRYYSFSRDPSIGLPYLAMEFVQGEPLSDRVAAGPLDSREAVLLFIRVAEGLAVAHEAGIVHRDLSPDNIILSNGDVRHPRIIDFGIARTVQTGDRTLIGSNFAGKYDFVSPEQLGMFGGDVTARSDLYSLALVMIGVLKGKALDMGGTHLTVVEKRRSVPDLDGLEPGLVPLLSTMLAPDPADRPQGATAVADWLEAYLAGNPPAVAPAASPLGVPYESPFGPGPTVPPRPAIVPQSGEPDRVGPRAKSRAPVMLAGLVALALVGGAGWAYVNSILGRTTDQPVAADNVGAESQPTEDKHSEAASAPVPGEPADGATETAGQPASGVEAVPQSGAATAGGEAEQAALPDTSGAVTAPADGSRIEPEQDAALATTPLPPAPASAVTGAPAGTSPDSDCFFATVAEAGDNVLVARGLGQSLSEFETIEKTLAGAGNKASIDAAAVTGAQCPVVEFLKATSPRAARKVKLGLASSTPPAGGALAVTVAGAAELPVHLVWIDDRGEVRLLESAPPGDAAAPGATIDARLDPAVFPGKASQILVALAGKVPLPDAKGSAAEFFPALTAALLGSTADFGLDFAHFRLSSPITELPFAPKAYSAGAIKPNHRSQEELDRALIDFYREWKTRYVVQECGEDRYFLGVNADGKAMEGGSAPDSITVSEAHGYGMLALALMAGADPEARRAFDGMHRYRADHPARSSPHLMAWNQVKGCGNAGEEQGGDNTATDGDLDIAYALLLADKAWGSAGEIDYRAAALATIAAILEHEVSAAGNYLMLGDWVSSSDDGRFRSATRTSDFMLSHLRAFADASGEKRWLTVRDRSYEIIETITGKYSPKTGLMPDFVVGLDKTPKPAAANFMEGESDGYFSWNAARYPWRVGLDFLLYGDPRAGAALGRLNQWVRGKVKDDPEKLADTYRLDGSVPENADTGALTFVSLMGVAAMIHADNQGWLNAIWDYTVAQKIEDDDFYGNTLKLLAMIAMSGHWAKPE